MFSVEGLPILDAISYIKDKLDILDKEIRLLKPQEHELDLIMSILVDSQSKLHEELAVQEDKARAKLKELGSVTAATMPVFENLFSSSADQHPPQTKIYHQWSEQDLAAAVTKLQKEKGDKYTADNILKALSKTYSGLTVGQVKEHMKTVVHCTEPAAGQGSTVQPPPQTKAYHRWSDDMVRDLAAAVEKVKKEIGDNYSAENVLNVLRKTYPSLTATQVQDRMKRDNKAAGKKSKIIFITLPDSKDTLSKVAGLLYTNSGGAILALGSNGYLRIWKWSGKATASVQPESGLVMENKVRRDHEETVSCLALSQNDAYVMSTCGETVSLFPTDSFQVLATLMPASTFLAFDPQDDKIAAFGMQDSSINICEVQSGVVKSKLEGHQKHITGLAFSTKLKVLVSSGADAQLFFWDSVSWVKKSSLPLELPMAKTQGCKTRSATGKAPEGNTGVQFHKDQIHLLVSHEKQLSIYDALKMERIHQWLPQRHLSCLTSASYSGNNSELVYALFANGRIGIFEAKSLIFKCHIDPAVYVSQPTPNSERIIAQVIVGNPKNRGLVAVGFSDGSVIVIEQSVA